MKSKRGFVLDHAVVIEEGMKNFLAGALGTEENASSIKNLPFSKKVAILEDLKKIEEPSRKKLNLYSHIRNKFAHDIEVIDFVTYFTKNDTNKDKIKSLKAFYEKEGTNHQDIEDELEYYFISLHNDIWNLIKEVIFNIWWEQIKEYTGSEILITMQQIHRAGEEGDEEAKNIWDYVMNNTYSRFLNR